MSSRYRLRVTGVPVDTKRVQSALRGGLALSADEAASFSSALPLELTFVGQGDAGARLHKHLAAGGLEVTELPVSAHAYAPCSQHQRIEASETCPKCQGRTCPACLKLNTPPLCPDCRRKHRRASRFKSVRVAVLLTVLAAVALSTYARTRRITSWSAPLSVVVHPVAMFEGSGDIESLTQAHFQPALNFFDREARRYDIDIQPFEFTLGKVLEEPPPPAPTDGSALSAISYSLGLRWWAWRLASKENLQDADVRFFALYFEPKGGAVLEHSFGLAEAGLGVVNIFGAQKLVQRNSVVLAHEVLHTVGAKDRYGPLGNPLFPEGYADPNRSPKYPQVRAEIMGASIPLSPTNSAPAKSHADCVVGPATAADIGWTKAP